MNAPERPLRVAERLKQAREERGVSYRQIADSTKLSPHHIRALEDDRIEFLPSGIYRRSIVRAVAREVGLDAEQALRAFLVEHPDDLPPPGGHPAPPPPSPSRPWRRVLAALGAVAPLAAGAVYLGPGWPPPVATPRPAVTGKVPVTDIEPAGGFHEVTSDASRPVVVLISVSSRSDLRIVADGRPLLGRAMEAGERVHVALGESLELSGDNASAVQVSINGLACRPLGGAGAPLAIRIDRRDYEGLLLSQ